MHIDKDREENKMQSQTEMIKTLALLAFVGFVIRGLFIYYLTYEAQKDRTINELIYDEQVSKTKCVFS